MATYKYFTKDGNKVQVESAVRDGSGKNIENNYAKQNGYYEGLTSGFADNLIPTETGIALSSTLGMNQTGYDDSTGVSSIDDSTDTIASVQGISVVRNNLVKNGNIADGTNYWLLNPPSRVSISASNGILTAEWLVNNAGFGIYKEDGTNSVVGHKYFTTITVKSSVNLSFTGNVGLYIFGVKAKTNFTLTANTTTVLSGIITSTSVNNKQFTLQLPASEIGTTIEITNCMTIDLTQFFGSNDRIPTYLTQQTPDIARFFNEFRYVDLQTYDTGTLVSTTTESVTSVGYNAFDGELELGWLDTTGSYVSSNTDILSKNFIKVIAGQTYTLSADNFTHTSCFVCEFDENQNFISGLRTNIYSTHQITLSDNTHYVKFWLYGGGTTFSEVPSDPQIAFHLAGTKTGYAEHVSNTNTLPSDTLRGIYGASGDTMTNGTTARKYGSYTFTGSETWIYTNNSYWRIDSYHMPFSPKFPSSGSEVPNIIMLNYSTDTFNNVFNNVQNKSISLLPSNQFGLYDSDFSSYTAEQVAQALAGKTIIYEKATETTETNDGYDENIAVQSQGTLSLDNTFGVVTIDYKKNLKQFIENIGNRNDINYNANNIASKSDLGVVWTKDLTSTELSGFMQAQVAGGCFYLVCSALGNGTSTTLTDIVIDISDAPSGTASSIYDDNGDTADQSTSGDVLVSLGIGRTASGTMKFGLYHTGANELTLKFEDTLASNTEKVDVRTYLTISLDIE